MAEDDALHNTPVVVDWGSGLIKAGIAGELEPKLFPNFVGHKKFQQAMSEVTMLRGVARGPGAQRTRKDGELFAGTHAMSMRGVLKLEYPMQSGVVNNWEDTRDMFSYLYSAQLKVNPEEHPVLISEPIFTSLKQRHKIAEILFERLHVPAVCFSAQAVLALYGMRRTSGLVVDSGHGLSQTVPIYEGFPIAEACNRWGLGGSAVTDHLKLLLTRGGYSFHTTAENEIVREIKEKGCYVSKNPLREEEAWQTNSSVADNATFRYTLPDGNIVTMQQERFRAPEVLFRPSILGSEYLGIHELAYDSIRKCDTELRRLFFSEILLCGGTTTTLGFGERMMNETRALAPKGATVRVRCSPDRHKVAWVGGSIFASLVTFKDMVVTRKEFEEDSHAIHKHAF